VLALLRRRRADDPVPVYLPVSSWQPARQPLLDWTAGQLGCRSARELRTLAGGRGLFFVLDGVGESAGVGESGARAAGDVFAALGRDLGGDGFVLACRSDAYHSAHPAPARAVVATVAPLPPGGSEQAGLVASGAAVERQVLGRWAPAGSAGARVAFLARHLGQSGGGTDIAWWRLAGAVPEVVRGLFVQLGAAVALAAALGLATGAAAASWFGLGFGLAFGLQGWPPGGRGGPIAWRASIMAVFAFALADVYQPWAGAAVSVAAGLLAWRGYGRLMGGVIVLAGAGMSALASVLDSGLVWATIMGWFLAFATGLAFWAVFAEARHRPSRITLRLPGTVGSFLRRFAAGFAASLLATFIIALVGWAGLALALSVGVATGLAAGLTVWLDAPARTYQSGPSETLRQDRAAALAAGLATGLVVGSGIWLGLALFVRLSQVRAFDVPDIAPVAIVAGLAAGVATALSRSWGGLALARVWFGLTGHLPWRLMAFLDGMCQRGVLVRSGSVYRFRSAR
jgi:hypothetical protein